VEPDAWVVMPNHVHGILIIVGRGEAFADSPVDSRGAPSANASPLRVSQAHGTKRGSLAAIIQNYKSVSSRLVNRARASPGVSIWQRGYYEHVIRGEDDMARIRKYISENPLHWELDEENPLRERA
jgi:REP element-mobilizing transposase RayT